MHKSHRWVPYVNSDNTMGFKRVHMKSTDFVNKSMDYIAETGYHPGYFDWMAAFASVISRAPYKHIRNAFSTNLHVNELPQMLFTFAVMALVQTVILFGGILLLPALLSHIYTEEKCNQVRDCRNDLIKRINLKL